MEYVPRRVNAASGETKTCFCEAGSLSNGRAGGAGSDAIELVRTLAAGTGWNARAFFDNRGTAVQIRKAGGKAATAIKVANHTAKRVDALTGVRSQSTHPIATVRARPQIELCSKTVSA